MNTITIQLHLQLQYKLNSQYMNTMFALKMQCVFCKVGIEILNTCTSINEFQTSKD
jgi:hypothetical protein